MNTSVYQVEELSTGELKSHEGGSKVCDIAAGFTVGVAVFQPHLAPSAMLALGVINIACSS